jgi:Na+-driven multidrug efflux pump
VLNAYALGLFLPNTGAAFAIAEHLNRLVVWSFAFFGVSIVLFGVLRATGTVIAPLLMLIVSLWLVRLPFAYLLAGRWQDDAIWWAFPVSSITSMLMAIAYFRYGPWRRDRMAISTAQNAAR